MSDLVWYVGNRSPAITQTITIDGVAFDLSSSTVRFKMRRPGSTTLKVDAAATIVTPPGTDGEVRYDWLAADVDTAAQYLCWWEVTTAGKVQEVGEALIEIRAHAPFGSRQLCGRGDVIRLVPGYSDDQSTDGILEDLIASESQTWLNETGREFVPIAAASSTRSFDVAWQHCATRKIRIGDANTITAVETSDQAGNTLAAVTAGDWVGLPRTRQAWQPITRIWFPPNSGAAVTLNPGYVLEVTGTWGFPAVPDDVRISVARMTLVRYLLDATQTGSQLSDALNEQGFDIAMAFAASQAVKRDYGRALVA
jgi:hypothetical protein